VPSKCRLLAASRNNHTPSLAAALTPFSAPEFSSIVDSHVYTQDCNRHEAAGFTYNSAAKSAYRWLYAFDLVEAPRLPGSVVRNAHHRG